MYRMKATWAVIVIVLIGLCPFRVRAHEPGLSFARIELAEHEIRVNLSFALRDLEILEKSALRMDSSAERSDQRDWLKKTLLRGTVVALNDQRIEGRFRSISGDSADGLRVELSYPSRIYGTIRFKSKLIERLALGHRQIVTWSQDGKEFETVLLSARSPETLFGRNSPSLGTEFYRYLIEGIRHIWIGADHILFLLSLLLPAAMLREDDRWRPNERLKSVALGVFKIVTAFTVAHSITLTLAVTGILRIPSAMVESLIALSVALAAANNIRPLIRTRLWLLTFAFGLIHGMGFASVLVDLGLPTQHRGFALLAFNIGVEIGQIEILAISLPLIFVLSRADFYRRIAMQSASLLIIAISVNWIIERIPEIRFPVAS